MERSTGKQMGKQTGQPEQQPVQQQPEQPVQYQAQQQIRNAAKRFVLNGEAESFIPYGAGHINRTFLVETKNGAKYILQKISEAFRVEEMMENIERVTAFMAGKCADERSVLHFIKTRDGKSFYKDESGYYRCMVFVDGCICLQAPRTPGDLAEAAGAFGNFMHMLADFPAGELHEPIVNFHNTPDRCRIFKEVLEKDPLGRAKNVQPEIAFFLEREERAGALQRMRESGQLPVRVTHNDTKLNNVLYDPVTGKAVCVLDLDTVMPGLAAYDFGDGVRFGAATAAEDERDLSLVHTDMELYRAFRDAYITACPELTQAEIESLPLGAWTMTLENGLRFLTDYLDGDRYFAIHREGQNLDRARTQIRLAEQMEENPEIAPFL